MSVSNAPIILRAKPHALTYKKQVRQSYNTHITETTTRQFNHMHNIALRCTTTFATITVTTNVLCDNKSAQHTHPPHHNKHSTHHTTLHHTHTHTHTHSHRAHKYTHTHTHAHTLSHTHSHTHAHSHTHTLTRTHTHTHTYLMRSLRKDKSIKNKSC